MQNEKIIYDDGEHKVLVFSFDTEEAEDKFLAVNQYLIVHKKSAVLIDPGSRVVFDEVYEAIQRHADIDDLKYIFFSHQDPDVADSISQWSVSSDAKLVISALWPRFMAHYGLMDMSRVVALPNKGARIHFGAEYLQFIPAHFLHSAGNFSLYDSYSKILFSGDIAASMTSDYSREEHSADFASLRESMEAFHKRYMAGNAFCKAWVEQVRKYDVKTIAPQHGVLLQDANVEEFLQWFAQLQCGGDLMSELY